MMDNVMPCNLNPLIIRLGVFRSCVSFPLSCLPTPAIMLLANIGLVSRFVVGYCCGIITIKYHSGFPTKHPVWADMARDSRTNRYRIRFCIARHAGCADLKEDKLMIWRPLTTGKNVASDRPDSLWYSVTFCHPSVPA